MLKLTQKKSAIIKTIYSNQVTKGKRILLLIAVSITLALTSCQKEIPSMYDDGIKKFTGIYDFEIEKEIDGVLHLNTAIGHIKIIDQNKLELRIAQLNGITKCKYILDYNLEKGFTIEGYNKAVIKTSENAIDFELDNTIFTGTYCCN